MLRPAPASNPQRQRRAEVVTFPAPVGGWISSRALAEPGGNGPSPQGAYRLDNFFPTATGCILRRGCKAYAQLGDDNRGVKSMFKYVSGENSRMFASTDRTIYDITTPLSAENSSLSLDDKETDIIDEQANTLGENSTKGLEVFENAKSGDWSTVQFGTTGGTYLIGMNGESTPFVFDGQDFFPYQKDGVFKLNYSDSAFPFAPGTTIKGQSSGATAKVYKTHRSPKSNDGYVYITDVVKGPFRDGEDITGEGAAAIGAKVKGSETLVMPGIKFPDKPEYSDLTTADLIYPWVYKQALYFIEKNSLRAWYLPPDKIGGDLISYPLNGYFDQGGSLLWGQSWSLASSDKGGLSAQNVFTTTEGQVAVFQGSSPSDASWTMVGVYRIGNPLGRHGFIMAGGDIIIATDVGYVALSKAVQIDFAALAPNAVSYPIQVAWTDAVSARPRNWQCVLWPEGQMVVVIPAQIDSLPPVWFVSNAATGAWSPFYNWPANCVLSWQGRLFYGSDRGLVFEAMVGGTDYGKPYTGVYVPLFSDAGKPTAYKSARMARIETRSAAEIEERLSCLFDFKTSLPPPPGPGNVASDNEWDNAEWNKSMWDSTKNPIITTRRHSVSGGGYRLAPVLQLTSGSAVPLDTEVITLDVTFESGDAFS